MQQFMEIMVMGFAMGTGVYALVLVVFAIADTVWTFFEDYEDHRLITSNRLAEIDRLRQNEVRRYGDPGERILMPSPYSATDVAAWYIQRNRGGWS